MRQREKEGGERESRMDFSLIRSHVSWCGLASLIMMRPLLLRGREKTGGRRERGGERRKRWNEASGRGQEVERGGQAEIENVKMDLEGLPRSLNSDHLWLHRGRRTSLVLMSMR